MGSLSIIDKQQNNSHLHHFVVQTRSFQIEKARDVDMYENLRNYIKRQNEKKKQEMEMSQELKRARREKELKHKRDKLTLGEIKEEINKNESRLNELRNEKHRLFTEFKKVLNEDETRKNLQRAKENAAFANLNMTFGPVTTSAPTLPSAPPKHFQSSISSSSGQQGPIMPSTSHSNSTIMPSSLHHLQPIQQMFYSQQQQQQQQQQQNVATSHSSLNPNVPHSAAMSIAREHAREHSREHHHSREHSRDHMRDHSRDHLRDHSREPPAVNLHHRINVPHRVPTPPRTLYGSQSASQSRHAPPTSQRPPDHHQPSSVSIYSNKPMPQVHPSAHSMSASMSSAPSIISSNAPVYVSDRHRMASNAAYKRSHEQAIAGGHPATSGGGPIPGHGPSGSDRGISQAQHHPHAYLHHPNFKHAMGHERPSMRDIHQIPQAFAAQLGGHNMAELQNHPIYQQLLNGGLSYGGGKLPANANPLAYLNNMERK